MSVVLEQLLSDARVRRSLPEPQLCRLLRKRAGLSQQDIAAILGVNRVAVTRYESGQRTPRGSLCIRYAELLQRLGQEITQDDEAPRATGAKSQPRPPRQDATMRSAQANARAASVIDLEAARARRRSHRAQWTFGFVERADLNTEPEPVLARLARQLKEQGHTPAECLALVVALPDDLWDAAWTQLREHIERERAA